MLFASIFIYAQDVPTTPPDSVKTGHSVGKIEIPNPKSILEGYTYDPVTNRYIYTASVDGFNIDYPLILTPEEYEKLVLKERMRKYFQEKTTALDPKKGTDDAKRNLLPRYYVNSKFFEAIFGGNTIDVKPTGSVEIDLGIRFSKQDNPSFSPRNRKTTAFDFNQRISMGLQGKVGTRMNVNINYDTQSTFAFQNLIKLDYTPTEDDILQKIEVGNVSFPISNSLIRGAQSLFGVKAQFQFGKTTFTGVFSEQKSQSRSITTQGGGTIQEFDFFALDYDSDKHYFLSQYFRNNYDKALRNYPVIDSRAQITRIEVWVTNKQNRVTTTDNNLRNIIALQDLGESQLTDGVTPIPDNEVVGIDLALNPTFFDVVANTPSDNKNNKFNPLAIDQAGSFLNSGIREIATASQGFNINSNPASTFSEGIDYSKLENARKLSSSEYTFHPQLGYISLNQKLQNDEVLAVAYQYTVGGEVFQVGEFANDGVESTTVNTSGVPTTQALILKMLKGSLINVSEPSWDLMMKNIYQIPGGNQLQQQDFKFNILYQDPSPLNYITQAGIDPLTPAVENTTLLKVFNLDKLNFTNDPQPNGDGFFDFYPGLTVDTQYGRIIFTTVEPFGKHLFEKLRLNGAESYDGGTYNTNQSKYVFRTLYKSTQAAALQESAKNKFKLKGSFKSTGGDGIPLGAFNVPQGSVVVTAGGRILVEGVDYTVNYQAGRVQILDPALLASNTPIQVSLENNSVFGQQTKRFYGLNVEHKFNDKFLVGGTFLKMTERPFTQKSDYNQESVNNTIVGLNTNFSTEVPFFTRLVNKLPNIETEAPSNLSFRGEFAYLFPNAPKTSNFNGEPTSYIDDFEGSQSNIDLKSPLSWSLASTPIGFGGELNEDDLTYGYKRAKLSWYNIDPVFYTSPPSGIDDNDLSSNKTRRIFSQELFPNIDIPQGQSNVISTLDLTYYPKERGPYNYNPVTASNNQFPAIDAPNNWGGIMRAINTTNFEQSNVEYVQFWLMDPYTGNVGDAANNTNTGTLTINLGEISEDVLKDGRKLYENGLPENGGSQPTVDTNWGKVPASQSLIYAFDTNEGNRTVQDVGLNGLNDSEEKVEYPAFAGLGDASADNYNYYLNTSGTILDRYKNYNGLEGNSPITVTDTNRGNSTLPDVEDINRDNTMNTINAYYKFNIPISPNPVVGQNYVSDVMVTTQTMANGQTTPVKWVQYKIPILEATAANIEGPITDFRTIRFMRMFLSGFSEDVTLRFGTLDLVRGEWRRYVNSLDANDLNVSDDDTGFDVVAINIQENSNRTPIPYVAPPGVDREQLYNNNSVINQNEQSLSLRVYKKDQGLPGLGGLEEDDSRAVFKNVNVDMRQYKKLRMFLHAEALEADAVGDRLQDDQLVAFIRFGNDFTDNFYQVEMPLKVSQFTARSADDVWPAENEIELPLSLLTRIKSLKIAGDGSIVPDVNGIAFLNESDLGSGNDRMNIGIKGNPNFGLIRTLMVGLKNPDPAATGPLRGEVWFNELRMSDMDNKGGYAAVANLDTNLADFATFSATGKLSTIGFGALEEGPNERSREDVKQYDIVSNLNLGQLLPKKWKLVLPFNYAVGEQIITPKYDPLYQDLELKEVLNATSDQAKKDEIENRAIDYTKRTSVNFIGVKKERAEQQKARFYDVENLTLSYSFNEMLHHDFQVQNLIDQQQKSSLDYAYSFKPMSIEPFKKNKFFKKNGYYKLFSDMNFNFLPSNISFSSNIMRQFNRQQFRLIDVQGIAIDPLYRRNYFFNYQYGVNFPITRSLKVNYTAANNNIVRNYFDSNKNPINELDIWDDYWNFGDPNTHNQQLLVNYDLPINKIPVLSFVKSSYVYTGDYSWQRSSDAFATFQALDGTVYQLGNTIQNANSHKINAALDMNTFYKYIGLTAKKQKKPAVPKTAPKPGEKVTNTVPKQNQTEERSGFAKFGIGLLTSVKNIQVNYTESGGTLLPGYLPGLGFFGTSRPTLGFVFGDQSDIRYEAAKRGYLTSYPEFNQSFTQIKSKKLDYTAMVELLPDFKIDINAERNITENYSEQYDAIDGNYQSRAPFNTGNFSISTVMIKTAFKASNEDESEIFDRFRKNRYAMATRLAEQYYGTSAYALDADGFPDGFGKNSQRVLVPAFLSAYTGTKTSSVQTGLFSNFPLPNWTVKYTGLMKLSWFKDNFKRFSIQHGYRSSYSVNAFRSNLNPSVRDQNDNIFADVITSNVNLTEQFNPLVNINFELKNSFNIMAEVKKDRSYNMSFDNNLLTEVQGNDYTLRLGYRIKGVEINSKLADNAQGVIKSDINLKADFTLRKNMTIVRYLDYDNNQLGGGQNIWNFKLTADYSFSKNFTAIFFYDHQFSKAVISTAFPLTNIRSGFTLRYNFGN
ncbi:T9SS outer membrane translocon Sov/SprA [Flavobacterium urocaniciphilum]|uniref:Protein involved in gliding motility SprA n=1 Tax=Flavobacterium urocaniciphilum TaxID=1299341 RepID=A0A1H9DJH7_9FLAO|nr:cell surface protein SprA [Flavobacterium urocaniciphilum]SEQ13589.1 protein involved in gliding motility SprA [Flavobacterium urocaniciphilum]